MTAMLRLLVVFAALVAAVQSAYIVGFHQGNSKNQEIVNAGASFAVTPSAEQVADLYVRSAGLSPLLWEGRIHLNLSCSAASF